MTFSQTYKDIRKRLSLPILFLMETFTYWVLLCRYNASMNTDADIRKMQYTLLRENHTIEKGMSIRNTRRGFGQAKVTALIQRLRLYNRLYGSQDKSFLIYPLSTIKAYIVYQNQDKVDIPEIKKLYATLCKEANISSDTIGVPAGIDRVLAANLQKEAVGNFSSLLYSRHSIRYFKDELPSKELLEQALSLSSRTPSACNRQAWHTHIYFGDDAHELLHMQGGCKGFCEDVHCCVVVTADMKGFLGHEPFQCYIDGGLYAQNLINALHYVGLGTIPLSCGFMRRKLKRIQKKFGIPPNEVMIVIIGTGVMFDEMKIAISTRKAVSTTNTYH